MRFEVLLTEGAERDLEEIYDYVEKFDSAKSADYVLDKLLEAAERLGQFPERGPHPPELLALGIREYPPGLLQTLPAHLPSDREASDHLFNRRRQARHAIAAVAPSARLVALPPTASGRMSGVR